MTENAEHPESAERPENAQHAESAPASDAEVEAERAQRLDPENRPENAEVDNTDRDFDVEKGLFTDSEGYDEADARFPAEGEQGA